MMPSPSHRDGAINFLGSTEVLQQVLLPRLTAVDLLRLSLSCKAMQSWLLSTPPDLWQDASRDAAAGVLACQTSTGEVLAAVRQAYTARHKIVTRAPAVRVETVRLPDQTCFGPQEHCSWQHKACRQMTFSSCGRWLAVVVWGYQSSFDPAQELRTPGVGMHEVVLYNTASGALQQQAQFWTHCSEPCIHWAHAAPNLCVATLPGHRSFTKVVQPYNPEPALPDGLAAFVVDAQTGSRMHALSPQVAQVSRLPSERCKKTVHRLSWMPCNNSCLLLVQWQRHDTGLGFLSVFDLVEDKALAGSVITSPLGDMTPHSFCVAAWRPGSPLGIVLPADMRLQQPKSFSQAGMAVGNLPDSYSLEPRAGFSSNGKHLIAQPQDWSFGRFVTGAKALALFSSRLKGLRICFTLEHVFPRGNLEICWVPGVSCLYVSEHRSDMLEESGSYDKVITLPVGSQPDHFLVQSSTTTPGREGRSFSPSGRFLVGKGPGGFCMVDLESGQQLWDATKDPDWHAQTKLGRIRALRGEPLGTGLGSRLNFCDWSPTGASFVCQVTIPSERGERPPMLRMYWLA